DEGGAAHPSTSAIRPIGLEPATTFPPRPFCQAGCDSAVARCPTKAEWLGRARGGELPAVVPHDPPDDVVGEAGEVVPEGGRVGEALGVRVVRAHQHAVGAELL